MTSALLLFPTVQEALIVTGQELKANQVVQLAKWPQKPKAAICGFGLPMAAAMSVSILNRLQPRSVFLLGIAGSYDIDRAPVSSVIHGNTAHVFGIGAGHGENHESFIDMGFDSLVDAGAEGSGLDLVVQDPAQSHGPIISVAAAAANPEEAEIHQRVMKDAIMEDMESYGVAIAARLSRCPLSVIRGISNEAGDRDKKNWQIVPALKSLRQEMLSILSTSK